MSFVDVGPPGRGGNGTGNSNENEGPHSQIVNTSKAPVLASCFSDTFTVYSAKKFPGVCESTALSKCFAAQGIKIPIRKEGERDGNDNPGKNADNADNYDDTSYPD